MKSIKEYLFNEKEDKYWIFYFTDQEIYYVQSLLIDFYKNKIDYLTLEFNLRNFGIDIEVETYKNTMKTLKMAEEFENRKSNKEFLYNDISKFIIIKDNQKYYVDGPMIDVYANYICAKMGNEEAIKYLKIPYLCAYKNSEFAEKKVKEVLEKDIDLLNIKNSKKIRKKYK